MRAALQSEGAWTLRGPRGDFRGPGVNAFYFNNHVFILTCIRKKIRHEHAVAVVWNEAKGSIRHWRAEQFEEE